MPTDGEKNVPITVTITVVFVLLVTLLAPGVVAIFEPEPVERPVSADDARIRGSLSLVQSGYGAGTYHFTALDIEFSNLVGRGIVVVQIGIPQLDNYVLTREFSVEERTPTDRTFDYQPSVEFHPDQINREQYLGQVTVRLRFKGTSRVVAERGFTVEVTDG